MKKRINNTAISLIFFFISFTTWACAQTRMLSSMPDGQWVTKVYISKALINLGSSISAQAAGRYGHLMKDIDSIEVYTCESIDMVKKAEIAFQDILKNYNVEEILSSKQPYESDFIYLCSPKKIAKPDALIIYNQTPADVNIVVLHGTIDVSEILGK